MAETQPSPQSGVVTLFAITVLSTYDRAPTTTGMHSRWTIGRQAGLRRDTDFMRRQDGRFGEKQRDACSLAPIAGTPRAPSHTALRGRDCLHITVHGITI